MECTIIGDLPQLNNKIHQDEGSLTGASSMHVGILFEISPGFFFLENSANRLLRISPGVCPRIYSIFSQKMQFKKKYGFFFPGFTLRNSVFFIGKCEEFFDDFLFFQNFFQNFCAGCTLKIFVNFLEIVLEILRISPEASTGVLTNIPLENPSAIPQSFVNEFL